ncbi:hypothetical protein [Magpiepox virus 2]|nr:hypothetical protein [Magpiepox virus 2]
MHLESIASNISMMGWIIMCHLLTIYSNWLTNIVLIIMFHFLTIIIQ